MTPTQAIAKAVEALKNSAEKLTLYYKRSAEYVGGLEHSLLQKQIEEALAALQAVKAVGEPFVPSDLEDRAHGDQGPKWYADAIRCLAEQLGYANDFYFPLLGAAQIIEEHTRLSVAPSPPDKRDG